ncbi:MAG TPA: hypothetical protein PLT03_04620, partial [Bacillota bacterium]|nr:hypothetical protein [Bacillota bacterium]
MRLLIVNPGSTSTKVAIFEDGRSAVAETLRHSNEALAQFPQVSDQLEFRSQAVREFLMSNGNPKLDAVVVTHRHSDHISGFSTEGAASGKVIAGLNPDVVVQPWTE